MALIATKVCKYIRPDSVSNPDASRYEYYLVWLGVDGGVYSWLFEDFELRKRISGDVVNTKSENITKLYKSSEKSVLLIGEDLTENEFDYLSSITRVLVAERKFPISTGKPPQKLGILTDRVEKPKSQFRYNFEIEVAEIEDKLMR